MFTVTFCGKFPIKRALFEPNDGGTRLLAQINRIIKNTPFDVSLRKNLKPSQNQNVILKWEN